MYSYTFFNNPCTLRPTNQVEAYETHIILRLLLDFFILILRLCTYTDFFNYVYRIN